jgi:hypothetical protein
MYVRGMGRWWLEWSTSLCADESVSGRLEPGVEKIDADGWVTDSTEAGGGWG